MCIAVQVEGGLAEAAAAGDLELLRTLLAGLPSHWKLNWMDGASTGCEFVYNCFRGTDSNRLVQEKVGAIGFRLLEAEPEMAICIRAPILRLRGCRGGPRSSAHPPGRSAPSSSSLLLSCFRNSGVSGTAPRCTFFLFITLKPRVE